MRVKKRSGATAMRSVGRLLLLLLLCGVALQLYFAGRIALMNLLMPQSTTFQRSEFARLMRDDGPLRWRQAPRSHAALPDNLRRAVIASEDAGFIEHNGIEWDAIERAYERNQAAEARAEKLNETRERRGQAPVAAKVVGGSTITQQLAKNLFLSSEQTALRKAQEAAIALMLEGLLSKSRILDIYLNNVEWGRGVFGAEAAAQHYFGVDAGRLSSAQAARLAVMLPAPKRFEQHPRSAYLNGRTRTIVARMPAVELP